MAEHASGRFDVDTKPSGSFGEGMTRLSVTKTFHGDLQGTSVGEMLAGRTKIQGSAGYVLIEQVEVSLSGKSGSFLLQHFGVMERGTPEARIVVVPDSGTGELIGIRGDMSINPSENHSYSFTYSFAETV